MISGYFYLIVLLIYADLSESALHSKYSVTPSECGFIHLSVSSMLSNKTRKDPTTFDKLELNWDLVDCQGVDDSQIPNKVGLFNVDPSAVAADPLEMVNIDDHIWNFYVTNVSLGYFDVPFEWTKKTRKSNKTILDASGPLCVPFWIASYRDSKLLKVNCLKIHPTWMADTKENIAHIPLSRLLIPGTHNAGSYGYGPGIIRNVLQRYVLCQDRDIWTQLVSGIRYLDFRISYYETLQSLFLPHKDTSNRFWLNHNMIKVTPLLPLLRDIRRFLDSTTDEIVIFDIHALPVGFYKSNDMILWRHNLLLDLLEREFGDHILSFQDVMRQTNAIVGPTVSEILSTGKRLIIGYPEKEVINQNPWLWPQVNHKWGNTNDPYILKTYLDSVMDDPYRPTNPGSNPLWSAMAQMTPTTLDIILNTEGSLRKMANAVNRNLTTWTHREWRNKANIIASDFYMGNNLVEIMVHWNDLKGRLLRKVLKRLLNN